MKKIEGQIHWEILIEPNQFSIVGICMILQYVDNNITVGTENPVKVTLSSRMEK